MVKIILDSSVIIEKIRTDKGMFDQLYERWKGGKVELMLPVVVIAELWAGKKMNNPDEEKLVEKIISKITRIGVGEEISKKAGELVRIDGILPMDGLIAACCFESNGYLATLNTKHFEKIKGLRLYKTKK